MSARTVICRFYTRGICRFGDMCRFLHPIDGSGVATATRAVSNISDNEEENENENESGNNTDESIIDTKKEIPPKSLKDYQINTQQNWANAPIFIPKSQNINNHNHLSNEITSASTSNANATTIFNPQSSCHDNDNYNTCNSLKSYAEIAGGGNIDDLNMAAGCSAPQSYNILCPYEIGCPYGIYCEYQQHGELCDMCGRFCLHPTDKEQRRQHKKECLQQHEKDMELSFAVARSQNKTCGICFDTIIEKSGREKRFGILPNCNHIFCLECIRKWRQAKQFENKITRSCPECRTSSDFVCPSSFWVDTKDEKDKLITEYKTALCDKDCKYFNKGKGKCPFGNKCFYKHELPNGVKVDVGIPQKRKVASEFGIMELFSDISLYEFIGTRGLPVSWFEFIANLQDSDESDWSEEME